MIVAYKNVPVKPETHKRMMRIKYRYGFNSFDEIVSMALDLLEERLGKKGRW